MFRLNNARMPRIKTRAAAAQQLRPSIGPEPKTPLRHQPKPQLKLIKGGKREKRKLCTFCANELKAQEHDSLMEWRRGAAIALGHKNPDFKGKREPVHEDIVRDMGVESSFNYPEIKKGF